MIGGPDDGADLYAADIAPCLRCGREVAMDWDGVLTWHYAAPPELLMWCRGSRSAWQIPGSWLEGR